MKINISENMKRMRRERGITQEGLSDVLGVSPQSVSNWERGDCYPDMELVPRIARYFEVTLDELFGMDTISDADRYEEVYKRYYELNQSIYKELEAENAPDTEENRRLSIERVRRSNEVASEYLREMAREFPNNWDIQELLACDYSGMAVWHTPEEREQRHAKQAEIYERMIEKCTDEERRLGAICGLADVYYNDDKVQLAIVTAKRLPRSDYSQEFLLERYYVGEKEGAEYLKAQTWRHANELYNAMRLRIVAECALGIGSAAEHFEMYQDCRNTQLKYMLYEGTRKSSLKGEGGVGDVEYANVFLNSSWHSLKFGDNESALDYIEIASEGYAKLLDYYEKLDNEKPLGEQRGRKKIATEGYMSYFNDAVFDAVREHPRFVAAMDRMRNTPVGLV
jgi:transcriptional regulator with XRE-family HTH domain